MMPRNRSLTRHGDGAIHLYLGWIENRIGPALAGLQWLVWPLLLGCAILGTIAMVSPSFFRAIATTGSRWVDTNKLLLKLDTTVNVDQIAFRYPRVFGLAVLVASLFLASIFWLHVRGGQFGF
jgi:hypothetical protein